MSFKSKYILAIALTALLIITNQIIIQYFLAQKRYDAKVINVSGKQRMLSQRLTGLIHHYHLKKDTEVRKDIQRDFEEWESVHYNLINGNRTLNIKKLPKDISIKLEEITPNITYAKETINNIENLNTDDLEQFEKNQSLFLKEMDKVVKTLEKTSDKKLTTIIITEIILALLTLIVLCLEVLWVFVPAVNQLAIQNKKLEDTKKVLEDYAFIASHDLRTPLANILGFLALFQRKAGHKLNEDELKYLDFINDGTRRMNQTTKDLSSYALAGKVEKDKVDFGQIVLDVLAEMEFDNKIKSSIKVGRLPKNIIADKVLMKLMFKNLISNAVKFIPKSRQPQIEISSEKKKGAYMFTVKDNGIGIADADRQKIFSIFRRLHNKEKYDGNGVGLALCKRIVEGHQGKIWVQSEEGNGSTFYFTIPI